MEFHKTLVSAIKHWVNGELKTAKEQIQSMIPEKYELPVAGDELGGVKNGGNVTVNEDGTLNADFSNIPSDEHINELIDTALNAIPDASEVAY